MLISQFLLRVHVGVRVAFHIEVGHTPSFTELPWGSPSNGPSLQFMDAHFTRELMAVINQRVR